MARWFVTRNDTQFPVDGLAELKELARKGQLAPSDMIQPPGTSEWLYAAEVPDLSGEFADRASSAYDDDDLDASSGGMATTLLAVMLVVVLVAAGYQAYGFMNKARSTPPDLIGANLDYSEMVITEQAVPVYQEPDASSPSLTTADKDSVWTLLAKRGEFYRARPKGGGPEGSIGTDKVLPIYLLGGGEVRDEYDPLYNPDRYVTIMNASWMQLPEQRADQITVFQFMLRNASQFDMTDLVMVATIQDAKGHELEKVEFRVNGIVPADGTTMVGTLVGEDDEQERKLITEHSFEEAQASDPDIALRYNVGVEVQMSTEDFTDAAIDIIELRAVPKG